MDVARLGRRAGRHRAVHHDRAGQEGLTHAHDRSMRRLARHLGRRRATRGRTDQPATPCSRTTPGRPVPHRRRWSTTRPDPRRRRARRRRRPAWPARCAAAASDAGDTVAWQSPNRWEAVALYRACWRLGAVAAPLHHQAGPAEVDRILAGLRPGAGGRPRRRGRRWSTTGEPVHDGRGAPRGPGRGAAHVGLDRDAQGRAAHPRRRSPTRPGSWPRCTACEPGDAILMPAPLAHISGLHERGHAARGDRA